jgi:low temperature requirement protein LtrA
VLGVGAGDADVGFELALIALLGLALSASLWWTYFSHEEAVERAMVDAPDAARPRLAILLGYVHIVLLFGVVLVATGLKKAIPEPLDPLSTATAVALAAGTAFFVAADAVMLRFLRVAQSPMRAVGPFAVLATIPLGAGVSSALQVAALALIVAVAVAVR